MKTKKFTSLESILIALFILVTAVCIAFIVLHFVDVPKSTSLDTNDLSPYLRHGLILLTLDQCSHCAIIMFYDGKIGIRSRKHSVHISPASGCGTIKHLSEPSGTFSSSNYPQNYDNSQTCMWEITVPEDKVVHLWFVEFHLEASTLCIGDHVTVGDDIGTLGTYCGHTAPKPLVSVGNKLTVSFISNSKTTDKGFQAKYEAINPSNTADIVGGGGLLHTETGEFMPPRTTGNTYMNNALYQWRLSVATNHRIRLTFSSFDLEPEGSAGCKDVVEVYDGDIKSSNKVGQFCGNQIPAPLYSSGNNLVVRFKSDSEVAGQGFHAQYITFTGNPPATESPPVTTTTPSYVESGCGSNALQHGRKGVLHSMNYPDTYPPDLDCKWNITVSHGWLIKLTFTDLSMDGEMGLCEGDKLTISDSSDLIGIFCGFVKPPVIISSNNQLFLTFETNRESFDTGFEIKWEAVHPEDIEEIQSCGGYSTEESGLIKSPMWPSKYAPNSMCLWRIEVQTGKKLTLKFTHFEIEDPDIISKSCYDYLAVYEENAGQVIKNGPYCGSLIPESFETQGNLIVLRFHSDFFTEGKGFRIFWSTDPLAEPPTEAPLPPNPWDDIQIDWPNQCGKPTYPPQINTRIVNGEQAVPHTWPWQVSMQVWPSSRNETIYFHTCGGTLIHKNWVLTAAHCFINYADELFRWRMCLGKHNLTIVEPSEECFKILGIFRHEGFKYPNIPVEYDIALVRLDGEVLASDVIDFACLPPKDQVLNQNDRCHATGWGDETGDSLSPKAAETLNQVALPVIPYDVCKTPQYWWFQIRDSMICAGYSLPDELKSVCQGDSGGPLVCPSITDKSVWELNGITSFGPIGCIMDKKPSVFTRVSAYLDWIDQTIKKNIYDVNVSGCGGPKDLHDKLGTFTSMSFPSTYKNNATCLWNIVAPEDKVIHLHFNSFVIEQSNDCLNDNLVISDELGSLGTHCGGSSPVDIVSYSNLLSVSFKTNGRLVETGFSATWEFVDPATIPHIALCGGHYNANYGEFFSPNWPNGTYHGSQACTWKITAGAGERLRIVFTDFTLQGANPAGICKDYVEIFDGDKAGASRLGHFCGTTIPSTINTTGNTAVIKFVTNDVMMFDGFRGYWTTNISNAADFPFSITKPWSDISIDWPTSCDIPVKPFSDAEQSKLGGLVPSLGHFSVQIHDRPNLPFLHRCTGTLINTQWILLPAHCLDNGQNPESLRVCAQSGSSNSCYGVDGVIRHKDFAYPQINDHSHDIALLHLSEHVSGFQPVCLPGSEQPIHAHAMCYWAGWAAATDLVLPVSIMEYEICSLPKYWWSQVTSSMICAGSKSPEELQSTCRSDTEGALICKSDVSPTWEVNSIASFGPSDCLLDKKPPVFTEIATYKDWIVDSIKKFTYESQSGTRAI